MKVCHTIDEMRAARHAARARAGLWAWCPPWERCTKGISSLVRMAKAQCDWVVVSIFINPLQFGPNEDLAKYPRNFDRDCELLEREGVDFIFAPTSGRDVSRGRSHLCDG